MAKDTVSAVLKKYDHNDAMLLAILQDIQAVENYLPKESLDQVAHELDIPLKRIYKLATFYRAFSLTPRGRHVVTVCTGTACHVKGAAPILSTLERELGIHPGETTSDLEYTVETVNCLGSCALAPLVVIDGTNHGRVIASKVMTLLKRAQGEEKDASEES